MDRGRVEIGEGQYVTDLSIRTVIHEERQDGEDGSVSLVWKARPKCLNGERVVTVGIRFSAETIKNNGLDLDGARHEAEKAIARELADMTKESTTAYYRALSERREQTESKAA